MKWLIKKFFKKITPPRYRYASVSVFRNLLGGYGHVSYSQNGEDIILESLFKKKKRGFYVDVGAHHPERYSNTHLLYKRGWRGVNIDPDPSAIRLFMECRPRDINICAGISRESGEMSYFMFADPAVNTFSVEMAAAWQKKGDIPLLKVVPVKTVPLSEVLAKAVPAGMRIDFLNVDAEGLDREVLESNDWARFMPDVIAVEAHGFRADAPCENGVYCFLREKEYSLIAVMKFSLIFVSEKTRA